MILRLAGRDIEENCCDLVTEMTDRAIVSVESIETIPDQRMVIIPMTRFEIVRRRRWSFLPNKQAMSNPIPCRLVIRQVIDTEMVDSRPEGLSDVAVIFGVSISDNTVSFSSAQENMGATCFSLDVSVASIDVELADIGGSDDSDDLISAGYGVT